MYFWFTALCLNLNYGIALNAQDRRYHRENIEIMICFPSVFATREHWRTMSGLFDNNWWMLRDQGQQCSAVSGVGHHTSTQGSSFYQKETFWTYTINPVHGIKLWLLLSHTTQVTVFIAHISTPAACSAQWPPHSDTGDTSSTPISWCQPRYIQPWTI